MKQQITFILVALHFLVATRVDAQHMEKASLPADFWKQFQKHIADDVLWQSLEGKAILLDFGTTYCPPCLESLNKFIELQEHYADKLHVFFITNQKEESLLKWKQQKKWKNVSGITILLDEGYFRRVFPHQAEPHLIWFDRNREQRYVTNGHKITADNMDAFLEGVVLNFDKKTDEYFDFATPLSDVVQDVNVLAVRDSSPFSLLTAYVPRFFPGFYKDVDTVRQQTRFIAVNQPILELYKLALGKWWDSSGPNPKEIIISNDSLKFYPINPAVDLEKWNKENRFCVEFVSPGIGEEANEQFLAFLDQAFSLESNFDTMIRPCLVLSRTSKNNEGTFVSIGTDTTNLKLSEMVLLLERLHTCMPVVNEIEKYVQIRSMRMITQEILNLISSGGEVSVLNKKLEPLGIKLAVQDRQIETLRLKEVSN
ncbi:thioredoxin family protein [Sphingobacterium alkalisoli]|uniref:Thioredoxin family protein n=1 Tax=Sphingobacterium alkalisoli TaxID=1874115 RepID=A0A4U0H5T9_9SPHI|nr:thioredoxin family protein [Sphingobacterium alkalisoli]TJY67127.1 thioredoxin family protein [Sphingobacterium alkalisoli]GGH12046.1 hypothetical protein GCM10011418_11310 [Sphingobacterium alkalisoli]